MTMPHLMNCPHAAEGWCLDCVAESHDYTTSLHWLLRRFVDDVMPTMNALGYNRTMGLDDFLSDVEGTLEARCLTCKDTGWMPSHHPDGTEFVCSCSDCDAHQRLQGI